MLKKFLAVVITSLLAVSMLLLSAFAEDTDIKSGTTGDCTWALNGTVLTISGNGKMGNYYFNNEAPWGKNITEVHFENGITNIGELAFYYCQRLTSITIPNSITSIGKYAFSNCRGLTNIIIPDSVTSIDYSAFQYCTGLTNIIISDSITIISGSAFRGCTGLTGITIPNSVRSIDSYAFDGCAGLTSIAIPDSVTSIGYCAFSDCIGLTSITIPDGVTSIDKFVFYDTGYYNNENNWENDVLYISNHLIEARKRVCGTYTIKDGTKNIAESAFSGCTELTSVIIPDSVTNIDYYAFQGCTGLASITIPDSVTSISDWSFSGCKIKELYIAEGSKTVTEKMVVCKSTLEKVTIPDSVTSMGNYVFSKCTNLKGVYIYDIAKWCNIDFGYGSSNPLYHAHNLYLNGEAVKEIVISETVTEISNYAFYNCTGLTKVTIPDSVTNIGSFAFYGCTELTSITIPNSVTSINSCTFSGCTSLTSVTIPDSVTNIGYSAFSGCTGLTNITIPNSVTNVSGSAFCNCIGLTRSITIPDSVASIGSNAFSGCTGLISITMPDSVTSIGDGAFSGCKIKELYIAEGSKTVTSKMVMCKDTLEKVNIPNSVTSIGDYTFYGCKSLTSITIPDSVTSMGREPFNGCKIKELYIAEGSKAVTSIMVMCESTLEKVTIPDSVTSIGYSAFSGCKVLTSITIPNSVTSIGNAAFSGCAGLTSITIPNSVTNIGKSAFSGCSRLTSITIPGSVISIGESVLSGCTEIQTIVVEKNNPAFHSDGNCIINTNEKSLLAGCKNSVIPTDGSVTSIDNDAFCSCKGLTSITIPNSVRSIGSYAFASCTGLTSITIPNSITSIGRAVFSNCEGLASVTIPDSVKSIGESAFSGCTNLTSIIIPNNVANIGNFAFFVCKGLISITMSDNVKIIGNRAFDNCEIKELYIAEGSKTVTSKMVVGQNTLEKVIIPDSVTSISNSAFSDCTALKEVHIKDIAKWCSIDFNDVYSNPLYYAHNLYLNGEAVKEIVIPETVTEISNYAFYNCTGLTKVTIPDSVTSIGYNTFTGRNDLVIETDSAYVYEYAISHGIDVVMDNSWIGSKKNPIVSVKVPDIKIIENTNGTQMDGYYYYNNFYVKCIASYKDGEKEYNYAEIDNGELEKQQTEHWTAGNTYSIKVKYGGIYATVNVTVIENPIEKIDIRNVTLEDGFIEENLYDAEDPQCTVTLKDGTVTEAEDSGYNGFYVLIYDREYELKINSDSEYIKSLKAGDSCKVECEVAGIKSSYYINIVSSPFKAIYIDDVVSEKSASGYYDYAPRSGIIELANGEKIKFSGTQVIYNGKYYSIGYDYQKQYDTPFTPGNTYEITATLGNLSTTYKVTAENGSQKEELEVNDVQLIKKPTKTEYMVGEVLDLRGAVIRLTFSDGSFEDIEITELSDKDYYSYNLFSKKLSTNFSLSTPYENWDYCISSMETSSIMLEAFFKSFECPVTAKENNWSVIKISDYYTATPKLTVTDKNGNVTVINIKGFGSYGGSGGGDPWLYNSMGIPCVLYTNVGFFKADCFCWVDGNAEFFNVYINNKKLKSNNIYGDLWNFNNVNYDINGDGTVDIRDLIALKKRLAADKTTENKPVDTEDNKIFDSTDLAELRKIILLQ